MEWYKFKFLKKFFLETTDWYVAWKKNTESVFKLIVNPKGYWLADPLLFTDEKNTYLFVEAFDKKEKKGKIGVFKFDGISFTDFKIVLEEPYHLSYPYVFEWNDNFFMIPESSQNNSIDLFMSKDFPYRWEKKCRLLSGNFVDTSLYYVKEDKFNFITYDMNKNELVEGILNMNNKELSIKSRREDSQYLLRPGGNFFYFENKLCHAVQNNQFFYGQNLRIIDSEWNLITEVYPENIGLDNKKIYRRNHTYSTEHDIEVIDISDYKFDFFKLMKRIWRKIWKK